MICCFVISQPTWSSLEIVLISLVSTTTFTLVNICHWERSNKEADLDSKVSPYQTNDTGKKKGGATNWTQKKQHEKYIDEVNEPRSST